MSYRARGAQITTLRSGPAPTPTGVQWASSGYIDFVTDCGADPTGVADCGPALATAYTLLKTLAANPRLPRSSCVLFIPPGLFRVATDTGVWDFLNLVSSLRIYGCQDASIFQMDQINGNVFTVANLPEVYIQGITFVGKTNDDVTADAHAAIEFGSGDLKARIVDCRFLYACVLYAHVYVYQCECSIENCEFGVSAALTAGPGAGGLIYASGAKKLDVQHTRFTDITSLNGYPFTVTKVGSNQTHIRCDDSAFGLRECVHVAQSFFDEGCVSAIVVDGGPTYNPASVIIRQCQFNTPINGGGTGAIVDVLNTDLCEINALDAKNATANPAIPLVRLTNVGTATLRGLSPLAGTFARFIKADAASKFITIDASPNLTAADIYDGTAARSLAKTTLVRTLGTTGVNDTMVDCYADLSSAAGLTTGLVVKRTAAGVAAIATTDGVGLVAGVTLDNPAGAAPIRIARPGQIVTAISDGSGAIAVGDPVTNLAALVAGQLVKATATGTTPVVGVAVTAAAGGGGAVPFNIFLQTGEV